MQVLRTAAAALPTYGVPDPTSNTADGEVAKVIAKVLHKQGLHEQFLDACRWSQKLRCPQPFDTSTVTFDRPWSSGPLSERGREGCGAGVALRSVLADGGPLGRFR
jgi:hypothetical protein